MFFENECFSRKGLHLYAGLMMQDILRSGLGQLPKASPNLGQLINKRLCWCAIARFLFFFYCLLLKIFLPTPLIITFQIILTPNISLYLPYYAKVC